jgi:hypothetical protein
MIVIVGIALVARGPEKIDWLSSYLYVTNRVHHALGELQKGSIQLLNFR